MRRVSTGPVWSALFALPSLLLCSLAPCQDEGSSRPTSQPAADAPATVPASRTTPRNRPGRNAPRRRLVALRVGTIHPVDGKAIDDGVILMRGRRIVAIGARDEVTVPAGAEIIDHPSAHAYPGLVDASSTAFAPQQELQAGATAGTNFYDALDPADLASQQFIRSGVTTAYVGSRSNATWRGQGALIRPQATGFGPFVEKRGATALQMRMTMGQSAMHAVDRQKQLTGQGKAFDLDAYTKSFEEHKKKLDEYQKAFKAYLDHYRKNNKNKTESSKPAKATGQPTSRPAAAPAAATPPSTKAQPPASTRPTSTPANGTAKAATPATAQPTKPGSNPNQAPKKPAYPQEPKKDPAKEALLQVKDGRLALRVEAHRVDEIRAVLHMAKEHNLPRVQLEEATQAKAIASELAEAGVSVVITDLLPDADARGYERDRDGSLPASLRTAGVPFAIGSGSNGAAMHLTMKAAFAAGCGLPVDAAIEAITLTPARLLGIDQWVGSLRKDKIADVVVTSGPLLASDTRILRVIAGGETVYDAKTNANGEARR